MRHALTKNMCPACGAALLGDFHMQRLGTIRDKISAQDFSRGLDQSVLFDMSLFIMSEFFPSNPNRAVSVGISEVEEEESESDLEKIREQVRRDALALSRSNAPPASVLDTEFDESEDSDEYESDEDSQYGEPDIPLSRSSQDLKVAKLKRLYNESPTLRKSGVSVRRVT